MNSGVRCVDTTRNSRPNPVVRRFWVDYIYYYFIFSSQPPQFLSLSLSLTRSDGCAAVGNPEGSHRSLHWLLSFHLLHGAGASFCRLLRRHGSLWLLRRSPSPPPPRRGGGGDAASAPPGSARRDHSGGAQGLRRHRSREALAHGHQGPDLWCLPEQVYCLTKPTPLFQIAFF